MRNPRPMTPNSRVHIRSPTRGKRFLNQVPTLALLGTIRDYLSFVDDGHLAMLSRVHDKSCTDSVGPIVSEIMLGKVQTVSGTASRHTSNIRPNYNPTY